MVAAARESNPATSHSQPSPEDEAAKRNTDCVYFLASPLTCKKGSECEYRHSEYARVNPRDCWYWLNGSCLNPKCSFRHPPLDGVLGTQPAASVGISLQAPQVVAPAPAACFQSKQGAQGAQGVPCIFFQKGFCMRAERCAFSHGPNTVSTKPPQLAPLAPETLGPKSMFGVPQRITQDSKFSQGMVSESTKFPVSNPVPKMSNAQPKTHSVVEKLLPPSRGFSDESSGYKSTTVALLLNGSSMPVSNRIHDHEISDGQVMHNGKDVDDVYRESSPGFDVLVDDKLAEDQFYDDNQYGTRGGNEGRNVNSFDLVHSTDYGSLSDADRDMFPNSRGYDYYEGASDKYSRDQGRRSPERISRVSSYADGRNDRKGDSTDSISQSDLRYRLKQRKGSGLRSVISSDHTRDTPNERRSSDYRRESRHLSPRESSLSSRFQGRIRDPRRSPPLRGSERDSERRRSRASPFQIRERIGIRAQEDFINERILRGYGTRRDGSEDDRAEFSGPKRLSELKACKNSVKDHLMSGQESFSLGKRKSIEVHEQHESDLSFDGPKPLSEILKRKKRSEMYTGESGATLEKETYDSRNSQSIEKDEEKSVTGVLDKAADGISASDQKTELVNDIQTFEAPEEGVIADKGMEDLEWEGEDGYEQGEDGEEYYYEEEDGEYNLEEGENAEGGECVDEEDGDGFEKKVDAILS